MTRLRLAIATGLIALLVAVMPASAAPKPGVHGGGFIKGLENSKTTLTISAFDDLVLGDSGQAQLVRHTPGSKANAVHITLQCVNVVGSTAIASGFGADGSMYLVVVRDGGEGGDTRDAFAVTQFLGAPVYCLGGLVPVDGTLGSIDGGNFQVSDGS